MPIGFAWWIAPHKALCFVAVLGTLGGFVGCASTSDATVASPVEPFRLAADSLTYGEVHEGLDRAERRLKWPAKLIPFVKHKEWKNEPSAETADRVLDYLDKNKLSDVHVYAHHYDPAGQWDRLVKNKKISPVWRYTFGTFSVASYTVLPGRVLGISRYNPYTDSLYANSEGLSQLMAEAAKAKDIDSRRFPGTYLAVTSLPGLSLVPHYRSVREVVVYAQDDKDWQLEREAYDHLYPRAGSETLSTLTDPLPLIWWAKPVVGMAGGAVGRTIGMKEAERRALELHAENQEYGSMPGENSAVATQPLRNSVEQSSYNVEDAPME